MTNRKEYRNVKELYTEMNVCIAALSEEFFEMDRMRIAADYIFARDVVIAFGESVKNYPKSIGEVDWRLFY